MLPDNNSKVKVSVLMPVFNAERYLKKAIDSVLNQSYPNLELLVCDDASTDKTSQIIEQYSDSRIKVFQNEENLGYLKTCNFLFSVCTGEYITFMDADDTCLENRIERQVKTFERNPDLDLVGTWVHIIDEDDRVVREDRRPLSHEDIMNTIYERNPFCSATVMIRRAVYESIGGYREQLDGFSYQDYDWTFLIAERFKVGNIPEFLYSYRQHPNSNSKAVSVKRRIGDKIVIALARQRELEGLDCLQAGEMSRFYNLVYEFSKPYNDDKSLLYQETALAFIYAGLPKRALRIILRAIWIEPFKIRNVKTLKYTIMECLRIRVAKPE